MGRKSEKERGECERASDDEENDDEKETHGRDAREDQVRFVRTRRCRTRRIGRTWKTERRKEGSAREKERGEMDEIENALARISISLDLGDVRGRDISSVKSIK